MEEYQAIRSKTSFLKLCKTPDLAAEVTVTAAHRLGVDAAIIFADILLIVEPMGLGLSLGCGLGWGLGVSCGMVGMVPIDVSGCGDRERLGLEPNRSTVCYGPGEGRGFQTGIRKFSRIILVILTEML